MTSQGERRHTDTRGLAGGFRATREAGISKLTSSKGGRQPPEAEGRMQASALQVSGTMGPVTPGSRLLASRLWTCFLVRRCPAHASLLLQPSGTHLWSFLPPSFPPQVVKAGTQATQVFVL